MGDIIRIGQVASERRQKAVVNDKQVIGLLERIASDYFDLGVIFLRIEKHEEYNTLGYQTMMEYVFARTQRGYPWYKKMTQQVRLRLEIPEFDQAIREKRLPQRTIRAMVPIIVPDNAARLLMRVSGQTYAEAQPFLSKERALVRKLVHHPRADQVEPRHMISFQLLEDEYDEYAKALDVAMRILGKKRPGAAIKYICQAALGEFASSNPEAFLDEEG